MLPPRKPSLRDKIEAEAMEALATAKAAAPLVKKTSKSIGKKTRKKVGKINNK